MRIQVKTIGLGRAPSITEYATRRVHQHLSRFGRELVAVTVRIADVNGPRGGEDKRCQVTASGPRVGTVILSDTHHEVFAVLDLVLDRLSHLLGRSLDRAREHLPLGEERSLT